MSKFSRLYAAQPQHLEGAIVTVEVDLLPGLNNFSIVGLTSKAVNEARDRVGSALMWQLLWGIYCPKTRCDSTLKVKYLLVN
jgi:hypothetical protein